MNFRNLFSVTATIVSFSVFSVAPALAKSESFPAALQDYYVASQRLQNQFLQTTFLLDKTFNQEPQVEQFRNLGEVFPDSFKAYKESYQNLQEYSKKSNIQRQYGGVLKKIEEEENDKGMPVLEKFSDRLKTFSSSMQQEVFTVYAKEGWANSGIRVEQGDIIWVKAEGAWQASSGYEPVSSEGYLCRPDAYALNRNAPLGALLYRVRGSSNVNGLALNEDSRGQADASGRLEFIMNDEDRSNNVGQLQLTVVVISRAELKNLGEAFEEIRELILEP